MDKPEPFIRIFLYRQLQHAHFYEGDPGTGTKYETITHYYGTGIDPKNYFRGLLQKDDYF